MGLLTPTSGVPTPQATPEARSGAPAASVSLGMTRPYGFHCGATSALKSAVERIPPPACRMRIRLTVPAAGGCANTRFGIQTVAASPARPAPEAPRNCLRESVGLFDREGGS